MARRRGAVPVLAVDCLDGRALRDPGRWWRWAGL